MAALVTVAGWLQLFRGPDLGLADNGDWRRILCRAGLQPLDPGRAFGEVVFRIAPLTDPVGSCDRAAARYASSQNVLMGVVRGVSAALGDPGLDLRLVGALACLLLGLGLGALYLALPGRRLARLLCSGLAAALLLDVSYAHYFSTAYTETAGLLGFVWTAAALAWVVRRPLSPSSLVTLLVPTSVLVFSKSQLTPLAILVVAAIALHAWQQRGHGAGRALAFVGAVVAVLGVGSNLYLSYQGPDFGYANRHNLVLYTLAPLTDDPAQALDEMGLAPEMAVYAGEGAFTTSAYENPDYPDFNKSVNRPDVLAFLTRHPGIAWQMTETALTEATDPRTPYLAELTRADQDGGEMAADRWAPATALLTWMRPAAVVVLPLLWGAMLGWGVVLSVRRTVRGRDLRAWGAPLAFIAAAAPAQVVICLLGDGFYELAKHEVFVSYLTWLALALTLGSLVQVVGAPRGGGAEPATGG